LDAADPAQFSLEAELALPCDIKTLIIVGEEVGDKLVGLEDTVGARVIIS
jgi:hypothetical protein